MQHTIYNRQFRQVVDLPYGARLVSLMALTLLVAGCPEGQTQWGGRQEPGPSGGGTSSGYRRGPGLPRPEPEPPPPALKDVWPPRAIWVARMTYRTPDDVVRVMDNCCRAGFNTVLFQVRGEGTVYYPSRIEPWGGEYANAPPNFDPLAVACREAHRRKMALHAWMNVMPAWRGDRPPTNPRQLYNAHPEWFWYDPQGHRQPLGEFYLSLNPCLPDVRQYLAALSREIITRYPVDGLHLDYIRFPMDEVRKGVDYPYDRHTLALYREATGLRPQDNTAAWNRWRTEQVTGLVREIRAMHKQARPNLLLTAACGPDLVEFKQRYFQDGAAWLRVGLVDAVFVMNYNTSTAAFRKRQDAWRQAAGGRMVVAGIGEYMHKDDQTTTEQLRLAKQWARGFALFSYQSLFTGEPAKQRRLAALGALIAGR
ncbi:MAG: family 10 glycosylhydrolase [Planctomycetes bacterium]|nr:family 10 glycosylhydrolase [Planctomycetota bacterium]